MSLTIKELKQSDYGIYVCVATNSKGETDSMKIKLEKPPKTTLKISSGANFMRINIAFVYMLPTILTLLFLR